MYTLWNALKEELSKIECEVCKSTKELYELDGTIFCKECLDNTAYEEE